MSQSIILCEGYHDRAFWAGLLEHLGCTDPGRREGTTGRVSVLDPWDEKVVGGQFGFHSRTEKFVRIQPCHGKDNVRREVRNTLDGERQRLQAGQANPRVKRLVFNIDSDTSVEQTSGKTGFRHQDLRAMVNEFDSSAEDTDDGDLLLFGGAITVSLIRWEASDGNVAGLPAQQTLERLACAALVAAYPPRGPAVQDWLDSRPEAPEAGPKEFGFSHMAGWYAEAGSEGFYRKLWGNARVVAELKNRLAECGAWRVAEVLAE